MVKAIVGGNWGDEGKGKITDICAADSDIVVRFQGGSNAGHTIINEHGKFSLHQLPSGIFYKNVSNVMANGVAINMEYLLKEIDMVKSAGINDFKLLISDRAHVLMPHHILLDVYEEERLGDRKFGSTKSGIAPLYSEKYAKTGLQVWELYGNDQELKQRIESIYEKTNLIFHHLYDKEPIAWLTVYESLRRYAEVLADNVTDTAAFLQRAVKDGKHILLEGQLGALRDTDHGIYPYVTSSSPLAGYATVGAGIPPTAFNDILVVIKAYSSAVGEGPFVTELFGDDAEELRRRGGDAGEYGATTGRPRRVGYFDAVATRYGASIQGATELALTGIDVLSYMESIPVCIGYEIDGNVTADFPTTSLLYKAKPVYEKLPGWGTDIRGVTDIARMPKNAMNYVRFIEDQIGVPVRMLSSGPKRNELMMLS